MDFNLFRKQIHVESIDSTLVNKDLVGKLVAYKNPVDGSVTLAQVSYVSPEYNKRINLYAIHGLDISNCVINRPLKTVCINSVSVDCLLAISLVLGLNDTNNGIGTIKELRDVNTYISNESDSCVANNIIDAIVLANNGYDVIRDVNGFYVVSNNNINIPVPPIIVDLGLVGEPKHLYAHCG